ncbi:MAG: RNA-dependent DNA polymerase, partial [Cyanobacteria bacterium J06648_1]
CGLKFSDDEEIQLHHIDQNHDNWKMVNLTAIHESCHDYLHMSKSYGKDCRELDARKRARPDLKERRED